MNTSSPKSSAGTYEVPYDADDDDPVFGSIDSLVIDGEEDDAEAAEAYLASIAGFASVPQAQTPPTRSAQAERLPPTRSADTSKRARSWEDKPVRLRRSHAAIIRPSADPAPVVHADASIDLSADLDVLDLPSVPPSSAAVATMLDEALEPPPLVRPASVTAPPSALYAPTAPMMQVPTMVGADALPFIDSAARDAETPVALASVALDAFARTPEVSAPRISEVSAPRAPEVSEPAASEASTLRADIPTGVTADSSLLTPVLVVPGQTLEGIPVDLTADDIFNVATQASRSRSRSSTLSVADDMIIDAGPMIPEPAMGRSGTTQVLSPAAHARVHTGETNAVGAPRIGVGDTSAAKIPRRPARADAGSMDCVSATPPIPERRSISNPPAPPRTAARPPVPHATPVPMASAPQPMAPAPAPQPMASKPAPQPMAPAPAPQPMVTKPAPMASKPAPPAEEGSRRRFRRLAAPTR